MKRIFAFFLSVVFVLGCIPQTILSVGASALDYTPGDLKIDGVINSTDVVYLRRYIAGGYGITLDERAADVNADGILNTTDIVCPVTGMISCLTSTSPQTEQCLPSVRPVVSQVGALAGSTTTTCWHSTSGAGFSSIP